MRRRTFVTLLGGAATWPLAARAQPSDRMRRVVVAMIMTENDPQSPLNVRAVRHGLTEERLGEGRDPQARLILFGNQQRRSHRCIGSGVADAAPDVFLVHGTAITASLHRRTRAVPIVFALVSNPVGSGFVESLARPGGNVTGFTNHFEPLVAAKWLELLKEIAPHLTRVAILFNPDIAAGPGGHFVQPLETAAASLRMEIRQLHSSQAGGHRAGRRRMGARAEWRIDRGA